MSKNNNCFDRFVYTILIHGKGPGTVRPGKDTPEYVPGIFYVICI